MIDATPEDVTPVDVMPEAITMIEATPLTVEQRAEIIRQLEAMPGDRGYYDRTGPVWNARPLRRKLGEGLLHERPLSGR